MYPNLNAEFARKNLTLKKVVEELKKRGIHMTVATLSQKKNGKYPITLDEAKALKDITGAEIPIEVLFEEKIEEGE